MVALVTELDPKCSINFETVIRTTIFNNLLACALLTTNLAGIRVFTYRYSCCPA